MINILYKYLEGIISKKENVFYYNQKKLISGFENSIYCPHPFTNWSLNPSYTKNNINEHTKEGFRKTADLDSVSEMVGNNIIYCAGGSTTYCTELYPFQKSWPFKLNQLVNDKFKVINAGVGGWGTLQSLIRFMSWGPFFKPRLTVIYQSKNDLTPLYNGRKSEDEIFLQYENIMVQYGLKNPYSFRSMFSRSGGGLAHVYTDKINPSPKGFFRFDQNIIDQSKSRYEMFSKISEMWGGKILFLTELIDRSSPYYEQMEILHKIMEDVSDKYRNSYFVNLYDIFPVKHESFLDKMHFSELGCDDFSKILYALCTKHIEFNSDL